MTTEGSFFSQSQVKYLQDYFWAAPMSPWQKIARRTSWIWAKQVLCRSNSNTTDHCGTVNREELIPLMLLYRLRESIQQCGRKHVMEALQALRGLRKNSSTLSHVREQAKVKTDKLKETAEQDGHIKIFLNQSFTTTKKKG